MPDAENGAPRSGADRQAGLHDLICGCPRSGFMSWGTPLIRLEVRLRWTRHALLCCCIGRGLARPRNRHKQALGVIR